MAELKATTTLGSGFAVVLDLGRLVNVDCRFRGQGSEMEDKSEACRMDEYLEHAVKLVVEYVSTRAVGIVLRDRVGNTGTGSSTCIRIGDHFLLATAAHVIEDLADSRIQLIPDGTLKSKPIPFISRSCHPGRSSQDGDLAWIEIDPSVARDLRFLELNDIVPSEVGSRKKAYWVHGYPYENAMITGTRTDVVSTAALTMIAKPQDIGRSLNIHELAVEWPPRDSVDSPIEVTPHPRGVSGGGIWHLPRDNEQTIYSTLHARLVGLNLRWDESRSVLFGAKMNGWLDLVSRDLPDTKDAIQDFLSRNE